MAERHVEQALRVTHHGFAEKFRIGFRNAEDFVRLFKDSVDRDSCLTAIVDGRASGILAAKTKERKFYELKNSTLFTTFWPLRTALVLFNLVLLTQILGDSVERDEFEVDTIAVDPTLRGLGIGSALMLKAEEVAKSRGKLKTSLHVISKNTGAIRLYERLGYKTTLTKQGFLVRLALKSEAVHRMEKPLGGA